MCVCVCVCVCVTETWRDRGTGQGWRQGGRRGAGREEREGGRGDRRQTCALPFARFVGSKSQVTVVYVSCASMPLFSCISLPCVSLYLMPCVSSMTFVRFGANVCVLCMYVLGMRVLSILVCQQQLPISVSHVGFKYIQSAHTHVPPYIHTTHTYIPTSRSHFLK